MRRILRIVSLITLWVALGTLIGYVDPLIVKNIGLPGSYLPFWILSGLTLWYTLAMTSKKLFMSLGMTLTIMMGLLLSFLKIMHWGLLIVLLLTLAIESWYTYKQR